MSHKLEKIDKKLKELSPFVFVVVMTILSFVFILPFLPVLYALEAFLGPMSGPSIMEKTLLHQIITLVLLAPLFETLIFQTVPILFLKSHSRLKPWVIILVSSLLFGATHSYSFAYIFFAFLVGLVLAYSYLIYLEKNVSAFWVVTAIHSLRNMFSLVLANV